MGYSVRQVTRRTGVRRHRLLYLEDSGAIGFVARADGRRTYTAEQVETIESIVRLRIGLGIGIDEAAAIATELLGGQPRLSSARILELIASVVDGTQRQARAAADLTALMRKRPMASPKTSRAA